ncbi:hypothetical protein EOB36_17695 [Mesorhizobium sp. M6A.T.Cr.TU.017.01.1.1]|uniref:hypothetical protein n=1 Tax=unclassified Mesorhizobium TaxID=325217 RepID=UPI000FD40108|nr:MULTISPECIES: hypothetical protein [unclassified Mesorhizobium]RUV00180.1 hypothetical protein EOB36_17695 [Mesorhizobium sp. M6A.T.Cr.TU.017.01.1.1]RWP47831.1 MAG: hypothetical protein EOR05_16430 [Mesorhizobium sp.]
MTEPNFGPAHLSFIQTQISRPLTVFVPPLHRHMAKQYVDMFWDNASLRLSTFDAFRQHKSEGQGDPLEGHASYMVNDQTQDRHFGTSTIVGANAYVLSFTSRTTLSKEFGDDFFEVVEPVVFSAEVANMIPGCTSVMIGSCIYVDAKLLIKIGPAPAINDLLVGDGSTAVSLDKLLAQGAAIQGPRQYFLKDRRYESQSEFRMVWETNAPVSAPLIVTLPALRQYCRRA